MADNTPPTGGEPSGQTPQEPPKTFTQDDINRILADEKRTYQKQLKDLKSKADEWDKYQQTQKTEAEKLNERIKAAEAERDALKTSLELDKARRKFGKKHNIPEADWDRLRGATADEIEQDAKEWAKTRGLDKAGGPTPQGGSGPARHPFNQAFLQATGRGGR